MGRRLAIEEACCFINDDAFGSVQKPRRQQSSILHRSPYKLSRPKLVFDPCTATPKAETVNAG